MINTDKCIYMVCYYSEVKCQWILAFASENYEDARVSFETAKRNFFKVSFTKSFVIGWHEE